MCFYVCWCWGVGCKCTENVNIVEKCHVTCSLALMASHMDSDGIQLHGNSWSSLNRATCIYIKRLRKTEAWNLPFY